jgi:hypothetical protein
MRLIVHGIVVEDTAVAVTGRVAVGSSYLNAATHWKRFRTQRAMVYPSSTMVGLSGGSFEGDSTIREYSA